MHPRRISSKVFKKCGLCPIGFRFMTLCTETDASHSVPQESACSRIPDPDTLEILTSIVSSPEHPPSILHKSSCLLKRNKTFHQIISNQDDSNHTFETKRRKSAAREFLFYGAPAKLLTVGDLVEERKKRYEEKKAAELQKAKRKAAKKAEKEQLRALRLMKGAYREEKKQKTAAVEGLLALTTSNVD